MSGSVLGVVFDPASHGVFSVSLEILWDDLVYVVDCLPLRLLLLLALDLVLALVVLLGLALVFFLVFFPALVRALVLFVA